jgi:hypothetical protein
MQVVCARRNEPIQARRLRSDSVFGVGIAA